MIRKPSVILLTVFLSIAAAISPVSSSTLEKTGFLNRHGTELLMDGKPYSAVSYNKVDLIWQCLRGGAEKEQALQSIRDIGKHGFRVIRFAATAFYPNQMNDWAFSKYWIAMDELIATARQCNIKLIPSVIWNPYLFPDMANETVQDMMTNKDSKSAQYLDMYLSQIVTRYKDDPTILFWEIGNELNLGADLEFMRPYGFSQLNDPNCGTAPMRVRRDNYTTEQLISFMRYNAQLIRKLDPNHLICSGYSVPRPAAQHIRASKGKIWIHDSPEETKTYIKDLHPDPIDIISIHFYAEPDCTVHFDNKDKDSAIILRTMKKICDEIGKPIVIGESGGQAFDDWNGKCPAFTKSLLNEAVDAQYPILLYWMGAADAPLRFDLDKTPALNKMLLDADKKLAEKVAKSHSKKD